MRYFVYFDSYRRPRKAISERELAETYHHDVDAFKEAMARLGQEGRTRNAAGHVGTLRFETEKELEAFLNETGEEIFGFYEGEAGSRPYNF